MKLKYIVSYKDKCFMLDGIPKPTGSDEPYYFSLRRHAENFVNHLFKEHQNIEDWKIEEVVLGHGTNHN